MRKTSLNEFKVFDVIFINLAWANMINIQVKNFIVKNHFLVNYFGPDKIKKKKKLYINISKQFLMHHDVSNSNIFNSIICSVAFLFSF